MSKKEDDDLEELYKKHSKKYDLTVEQLKFMDNYMMENYNLEGGDLNDNKRQIK